MVSADKVRQGQKIFEAHFRVGNRDLPIPEGEDVKSMAARVVAAFEEPHQCISMSPDARSVFAGLQACANTSAAMHRSDQQDHVAARNGLAPWHIGILAASNLIFEIAC